MNASAAANISWGLVASVLIIAITTCIITDTGNVQEDSMRERLQGQWIRTCMKENNVRYSSIEDKDGLKECLDDIPGYIIDWDEIVSE